MPITSDERLKILDISLEFFNILEKRYKIRQILLFWKNLMTKETWNNLKSSITGFYLYYIHIKDGNSLNPGFLNSDLIESLFCQKKWIRNGLNTNPALAQYGQS
jgi:hypothetical protein